MIRIVALALLLAASAGAQLLPPPGDGDIRTVYWELRDQTDIFVALVPHAPDGASTPPGMMIRIRRSFAGKGSPPRPNGGTMLYIEAPVGTVWAPKPELWVVADGRRFDLTAERMGGVVSATGGDYLAGQISVADLTSIAAARDVHGSVAGVAFSLTGKQRGALVEFLARVAHP
jgi:hypothetical protein